MAIMTIRDAINETIREAMRRDKDVIMLGEDIAGGAGTAGGQEAIGGIWGTSVGLVGEFGPERVIDTPISESASFIKPLASAGVVGSATFNPGIAVSKL